MEKELEAKVLCNWRTKVREIYQNSFSFDNAKEFSNLLRLSLPVWRRQDNCSDGLNPPTQHGCLRSTYFNRQYIIGMFYVLLVCSNNAMCQGGFLHALCARKLSHAIIHDHSWMISSSVKAIP